MTWNYAHIANVEISDPIRLICELKGFKFPKICTQEKLMGEVEYVE